MKASELRRYQVPVLKLKKDYTTYINEFFEGAKGVTKMLKIRHELYNDKAMYDRYLKTKNYETAVHLLWHIKGSVKVSPYDVVV
jgi:hypothetical protein